MASRARAVTFVVIGALVATTTCASQADFGPEALDPPVLAYGHDALGRLRAVGDPGGDTAIYRYDAVGNLAAVERVPSDELSVVDVVPSRAPPGAEVTVWGTGFDPRRSGNTVSVGGDEAEVTDAGPFQLTVEVPPDAPPGAVAVEVTSGGETASYDYTLEPDRRPVVTRVSPRAVAPGDEVRIDGRNFTGDPLLDQVVLGGTAYAAVTSASPTSLVATVPPTAPASGRVSVATPHGTGRSDDSLVVAPLGYPAADVGGLTRLELGETVDLSPDAGSVELLTFDGRRGEAVALSLSSASCTDVAIGLADPFGVELVDPRSPLVTPGRAPADPWCDDGSSDATAIVLPATGRYTLTVEGEGSVGLTVDEGDRAGPTDPVGDEPAVPALAGLDGPLDGLPWLPVDLGSGALVVEATDMSVGDLLPVALTRSQWPVAGGSASASGSGPFGLGSGLELGMRLRPSPALQYVQLLLPNGLPVIFDRTTGGTDRASAVFVHGTTPTVFLGATVAWSGTGWDLRLVDGTTLEFAHDGLLRAVRDRNGTAVTVRWEDAGRVASVHSPAGRGLTFRHDGRDRIVEARDQLGDTVAYRYDAAGRLAGVTTTPTGEESSSIGYGYDAAGRITRVTSGRGVASVDYDGAGRVVRQRLDDGTTWSFAYTTADRDTGVDDLTIEGVARATVTDPLGSVRRVSFDAHGRWTRDIRASGADDEQTVTATRDPTTGLVTTHTDPSGTSTDLTYSPAGALASASSGGDGAEVEAGYGGEAPFLPTSLQGPDGLSSDMSYDGAGNLVEVSTPAGGTLRFDHDGRGRLTGVTDANGSTTTFAYELAHRVTTTDPLGRTATEFHDAAGRLAARTDASGATTTYAYDGFGRLRTITDPLGGETTLDLDDTGVVATLTDAAGGATSSAHDRLGRVTRRTDPSGATDRYTYDAAGNLVARTDRRGIDSRFTYDLLGRLTVARYGEATVRYRYDPAGRLVRVDDSEYGVVTLTYDDLGRLTGESSPQGEVEHTYDAAGRRTSTAVDGGEPIAYGYDAGTGLLDAVAQGDAEVALAHDGLGRIARLDLPHGVRGEYAYDARGGLVGLDWTAGGASLGDLGYRYDAAGRRRAVDGSLAPSLLPAPFETGDADLRYDAAGNLVDDGTRTYEWDTRGRLAAVSADGREVARFAYDPFGRRTAKSVDGVTTSSTYDGLDVVRTQVGDDETTYLGGPGLDDIYARVVGDEVTSYLTDAQGSVVGLVGPGGDLATTYDYDPFGRVERRGAPDPNPFTYTGRELDGTGLLNLRARYYAPERGRFLSQDPLGLAGGDPSLYAYAANDPVDLTDPLGLQAGNVAATAACAAGAAYWLGVVTENVDRLLEILDPGGPVPLGSDEAQVELDRINRDNLAALEVFLTVCTIAFSSTGFGGIASRGTASFGRALATRFPTTATRLTTRFPSLAPHLALPTLESTAPALAPIVLGPGPRPFGELGRGPTALAELANPTTVNNAASPIRSFVTAEDVIFYRVFSGNSRVGGYLVGARPASAAEAIEGLALPPANRAEFIQEVLVPARTRLQSSVASPAFGQPGGLLQFQLLDQIPIKNFGPGVLFP